MFEKYARFFQIFSGLRNFTTNSGQKKEKQRLSGNNGEL